MTENATITENELAEAALTWLRARLPPSWGVGPSNLADLQGKSDGAIELRGPNGTGTTMIVEVKRTFGPRDIDRTLGVIGRTLRTIAGNTPILVVAPWLSKRTQELLRDEHLNYLDLTGNALIQIENPTLFVATQGASKDPSPPKRSKARVQGPKAGRLIRLLADVRPPYGVRELATTAGTSPGYVSRLLDALDDEALVERSARGRVESVDVPRLLRRWAESYDLFRSNQPSRFLARTGASALLPRLGTVGPRVAITGSFAAVRLAPVAGPALLAAYTDSPEDVARSLDLFPTDEGANVVLLKPFDVAVWERTLEDAGVTYVAPSQAAVDCLTGNGRMPAEGEALLRWMAEDESRWRLPTLERATKTGRR